MAILLEDSFTQADGLLNGHAPDVGPGTWTSADSMYAAGCLVSGNAVVADGYYGPPSITDVGNAWYSFGEVENAGVYGEFALVLGPTVDGVDSYNAMVLETVLYGAYLTVAVKYIAPQWFLTVSGNAGEGSVDITSLVTPSGLIEGSFTLLDGAQTATVGAMDATSSSTFTNTWQGLDNITVRMAGFAKLDGLMVQEAVEFVSGSELTCPVGILSATGYSVGSKLFAPMATLYATGHEGANNAQLTAPMPTLIAHSGASSLLSAPSPALFISTGGNVSATPPSPRLTSSAHDSTGEQAAFLTAPRPTLTITTGANSKNTAPHPALTASATGTILATATLSAPKPTLSAAGKVSSMANATLSAPGPNLVGYGGTVCSVTVGSATLTATGTTGGVASVAVTCPLFELTATASTGNVATANLIAPSPELGRTIQAWLTAPSARLTAIGSAVVTATYEAYAVNLGHRPRVTNQELPVDEVTHYTNFPFTHVVRYQNSYYGANSTGLYLLEGTTDDGTAIPWAVKTAMDDFKTPVKKTVAAAYFGGRFGPASTVQLHAGEDTPNTYTYSTPRDALAQNHRQVFGKGVKERYYAIGASGTGTLELDTVELETHNMTRRI